MRFLADMGISRSTATDEAVLALALRDQRVVLTFDLDFGHILAASHEGAPSVIILRLSSARPERVNAHLEGLLRDGSVAPVLGEGAIVVVEDERRRVRKLPIGT